MNCGRLLRDTHAGSRNAFTVGNGHHLRATPETWNGPGSRHIARVSGPGGRCAAPGRPGNWLTWGGKPGKAPSISYMEGALLHSARQWGFRHRATPVNPDGQPPIIDFASKAGKPRNSFITSATRCRRTASTGPTG